MEKIIYPIRINKYLAHTGIATRRKADLLIARGLITINGKQAVLGQLVQAKDIVNATEKRPRKTPEYFAYNKPKGIVSHNPKDLLPLERLDKDSRGLIILTNDGRAINHFLNSSREHEKEYRVTVQETIRPHALKLLERGIMVDAEKTKPCKIQTLGKHAFLITLAEGSKHLVRRMCAAVRLTVTDLELVRIINIKLENLKPDALRPIKGAELARFLSRLEP